MAHRVWISKERKTKAGRIIQVLGLSLFVFLLVAGGVIGCKKKAVEEAGLPEAKGQVIREGLNDFEGTVKVALGKYLYLPEAQGFDIIVQGKVNSGDASALAGKEIRGKGVFSSDLPSILVAENIEAKEPNRGWVSVFTRTEEVVLDDYLDLRAREEFQALKNIYYDRKETWEGKGKAKIYGKLERETVGQGDQQKEINRIVILDEENKQVGKVIVDHLTDFAKYYLQKLKIFDNLWFYFEIKDTVEWRTRRVTDELFHADVLYCGLF